MADKKKISFATKVFIGLILGVIFGLILPDLALKFSLIGTLFTQALKMLVLPMILVCVTAGIARIGDPKSIGKLGGGVLIYAIAANVFGSSMGVLSSVIMNPAKGFELPNLEAAEAVTSLYLF